MGKVSSSRRKCQQEPGAASHQKAGLCLDGRGSCGLAYHAGGLNSHGEKVLTKKQSTHTLATKSMLSSTQLAARRLPMLLSGLTALSVDMLKLLQSSPVSRPHLHDKHCSHWSQFSRHCNLGQVSATQAPRFLHHCHRKLYIAQLN
jgi:hypothetical protein